MWPKDKEEKMIVNATPVNYVIVELKREDIHHMMKGGSVYMKSYAAHDEPVLVRAYCCEPCSPEYEEKDDCGFCPR